MICRFRTGGDEFVVILENDDYENRDKLFNEIRKTSYENAKTVDGIIIASGIAVHHENENFQEVFRKADQAMYDDKNKLKELRPDHNLR